MNTLLLVILLLLLLVSIIVITRASLKASMRRTYFDDEYEETIETTEITTFEEPKVVGNLRAILTTRGQRFVKDPVDGDTVYLNSHDDMYEDGAGKIWKLV